MWGSHKTSQKAALMERQMRVWDESLLGCKSWGSPEVYFSLSYFAIKNCVKPPGQVCFVHDNNSWTMSLSSSWTTRSFILFCPVFPRQQAKVNPAQSTQQEPSLPFQLEPIGGIFPPLQVPVSYFPPFSFWSALHSLAWKKKWPNLCYWNMNIFFLGKIFTTYRIYINSTSTVDYNIQLFY